MQNEPNYYKVLGLAENASQDDVKKNYRDLARKYHPDVCKTPEAETRFKEINQANEVLSDPAKRQEYDRRRQGAPVFTGFGPGFANGMTDPFGWNLNFVHPQQRVPQNSPVHVVIHVTAESTLKPQRQKVVYDRQAFCASCSGKGGMDGQTTCPKCSGTGFATESYRQGHNVYQTITECPRCRQRGFIHTTACKECIGFGIRTERIENEIALPIGCGNRRIHVAQGGNLESPAQPAGILILDVLLQPHSRFQYEPNGALLAMQYLDPVAALLGTQLKVFTIDSAEVTLDVPSHCPNGYRAEFPGLGLPRNEHERGNLYVQIAYDLPQQITAEQETLLKQYLSLKDTPPAASYGKEKQK